MEAPDDLPGYSLLRGRPDDALIVAEHPRLNAEVIYFGDKKLVRSPEQELVQAVDLASDAEELTPHGPETQEYATLEAEVAARATEERARWSSVSTASAATPVSEETEQQLNALGYGGDGGD